MAVRTGIAIIGVGNEFRHDDGAGWAVVRTLAERARERPLPPGTRLEVCDGDPARLIALWEGADLAVVLDAAHAHPGHPGRLHRLAAEGPALTAARSPEASSHGLGLGEAVELSRALGRLPRRLVVYAVEGADHSMGTGLSEPVAEAVERLALLVEDEITAHRSAEGDAR
ncbi:hydrogenase maturation protease [Streptomyces sp. NPDC048172]|uniref:hydrogenase maturation protease n=1 Tax=Streptomyces sp. NPDC048172 TaxID=3365505 RepID=UPI003710EE6F